MTVRRLVDDYSVDIDKAFSIGERLRVSIAGASFDTGAEKPVEVTVSVGISEFCRVGQSIDAILRKADERLYRAKDQGRNTVVEA